jgi:hypothetical protein
VPLFLQAAMKKVGIGALAGPVSLFSYDSEDKERRRKTERDQRERIPALYVLSSDPSTTSTLISNWARLAAFSLYHTVKATQTATPCRSCAGVTRLSSCESSPLGAGGRIEKAAISLDYVWQG